jgi:2'-5' RNA ligase
VVRLEQVRQLLDPIQARLIPAHVTLCREDELHELDLAGLDSALNSHIARPVTLKFGGPEVFMGHGVLLPCIEGEEDFHELRRRILGSPLNRRHTPHITLAHPRNPRSPQNTQANLESLPTGLVITFAAIQHIVQDGQAPWRVIAEKPLAKAANSDA